MYSDRTRTTLICLAAATVVQAQYRGPVNGYGPPDGTFGGDNGFGPGGGSFRDGIGFDVDKATHYRTVHGILAALAFVILFPIGAMSMRIIPGRLALWVHAIIQVVSYICFIAGASLGIWLVQEVRIPAAGGRLLNIAGISYHPIIGLVVLAALFFQPVLGLIHHARFKKLRRRQIWSHLHLWNGRLMIPLGIINGGLGLQIAGASSRLVAAYAAVAAIMGGLWILVSVVSEARRAKRTERGRQSMTPPAMTQGSSPPRMVSEREGPRGKSPVGQHRSREASQSSYSQ